MKRFGLLLLLVLAAFQFSGCYHATIVTGAQPGETVIDLPWAACWLFGLVPPKIVEAAAQCPGGVAKVETEHSFLNGLVGMLTASIFTPIHIKVTCAAGGSKVSGVMETLPPDEDMADIVVPENASNQEVLEAFQAAARQAVKTGAPVFVKF